ncbi:uncharacterized protein NDAI_0C00380 [Naumovozyma dairenensis CBS 421]|uniref:Uncharacterized protein n=1 Tax=Naumovozyma dairenensis (strain ATCC 10597 / BCRC 20456 / CBS 421 / NBRC 0211 / NRRL Y-12639) TaxID=1071378 RepID=G0W7D8_NAUDC|nr:hypothetical protein NDAI_0C00380 [Naumovozyma dairenensis CBS 421]CCD23699.1 hypothetical protein NDAI_0C00380 [Naumovozyma dairenensis CBS 421]
MSTQTFMSNNNINPFSSINQNWSHTNQKDSRISTNNHTRETSYSSLQMSSSVAYQEYDDEDLIVDLNTGSFTPVNLRSWALMTEVTDKLGKL